MARWGDERTIQFIHLYRDYECLWKPTSPLYKNKIARANAYTKIQEEFSLTEKEIKNKIKSLRSTYHQEKNKVENSKRSGAGSSDIYKPSLIWYMEMDFINENFEYRNSIQTAVVQQSSQSNTETETSRSQRGTSSNQQSSSQTVNPPNNETFSVAVDQSHSSNQASITNEQVSSPSLQDQQSSSRTAAVNRPHKTSQTKKKRVEQNETLTALQRLENIATAINNPASNEKEKDEFYYFEQNVAAQ
ncbi:unnamed protein product [Parnassius apollo]|uniref:(apollo) hypothetical protein n=1 Tax=Parnassius apollo TaxID=110799 RepID=A0A8S3XY41_PARAO|nr:unnamed protein product [Parnassius apollo]